MNHESFFSQYAHKCKKTLSSLKKYSHFPFPFFLRNEVMNGVTHGLGIVLCVIGAVMLSNRVKGYSRNHVLR